MFMEMLRLPGADSGNFKGDGYEKNGDLFQYFTGDLGLRNMVGFFFFCIL